MERRRCLVLDTDLQKTGHPHPTFPMKVAIHSLLKIIVNWEVTPHSLTQRNN